MSKKATAYTQAIHLLQELKRTYPTHTLGQHIAMSTSDYGDVWGITDKELLFALEKYKAELDFNIVPDESVDKIVRDAQDLDKLLGEEEEENYD